MEKEWEYYLNKINKMLKDEKYEEDFIFLDSVKWWIEENQQVEDKQIEVIEVLLKKYN